MLPGSDIFLCIITKNRIWYIKRERMDLGKPESEKNDNCVQTIGIPQKNRKQFCREKKTA